MAQSKDYYYITPEAYLEAEKQSPIKHEYIRGEVYAMAGGSKAHDSIGLNILTILKPHVRGTGCRVHTSDMKVQIERGNVYYYPDASVTCDERDMSSPNEHFIRYPSLIVEVLSPSTELFNRVGKFADYRQSETLQEYVLISQDKKNVECFRRNEAGRWELYTYGEGDEIHLASVDLRFSIELVYEDVLGFN